jgi:glyoxylase-like metal-dependent hydrolase (beta-lactamase superfamily II)
VTDGVYRIPLPLPQDGLRAVNVYAIESTNGLTLIDSGWALKESETALIAALHEIGYSLDDVSQFLVTHAHRDHYTQAIALRERFGFQVALGRGEQPSINALNGDPAHRPDGVITALLRCGAAELAQTIAGGWRQEDFDVSVWQPPDVWLEDGVELELGTRTLRAIATPGHTRGHLVFRDAEAGVLFAGDHVLPHITPSVGFEQVPEESPLAAYLGALRLIRDLPDTQLLPAHGPVVASTHTRVDELLEHHRVRLAQCAQAIADGAVTALDCARLLTWTRHKHRLTELQPFDQMLAIVETDAHLLVLVSTGQLRRTTADGVGCYQPTS